MANARLIHGDCLAVMPTLEDGSIDLILADPPYGTIKNAPSTWDADKTKWDTTINHETMLTECGRVLRTNGALCLFSQDPYTQKLITETSGNLPFSYRYTWLKDSFANALLCNKAPVNYTEDVCVFRRRDGLPEKSDYSTPNPLREYFNKWLKDSSVTKKQALLTVGSSASHYFTTGVQFRLPTLKNYKALAALAGFSLSYSELIKIQENFKSQRDIERAAHLNEHRAKFPTVFNLTTGKKYKSNVLQYKKDYTGLHPTQKPVALMEDLIKTYTNEGETVLDFTMGSGTTGVACKNLDRNFIGIEMDAEYFKIAEDRINA